MRHNTCLLIVLLFTLPLGACSSQPRTPGGVIIDDRGVNPDDYAADLGECAEYADQVRAGEKVAASTAGAVVGAVKGIGNVSRERSLVVKNCLRHRGYTVLN